MSSNSQITLRNGKTLTCTNSADSTKLTHGEEIVNMENNNETANEQAQSGQSPSDPEIESQRTNEERFSHLQSEMSMLKAMMEKLLEQNEERNRQTDTNAATSSFTVRSSNNHPDTTTPIKQNPYADMNLCTRVRPQSLLEINKIEINDKTLQLPIPSVTGNLRPSDKIRKDFSPLRYSTENQQFIKKV